MKLKGAINLKRLQETFWNVELRSWPMSTDKDDAVKSSSVMRPLDKQLQPGISCRGQQLTLPLSQVLVEAPNPAQH